MGYDAKNAGASVRISREFKTAEHTADKVYILENDTLAVYDRDFNKLTEHKNLADAIGIACGENENFLLTFTQIEKLS